MQTTAMQGVGIWPLNLPNLYIDPCPIIITTGIAIHLNYYLEEPPIIHDGRIKLFTSLLLCGGVGADAAR